MTETFEIDQRVTVTVQTPAPTDLHIGQYGERYGGQYGEHRSAQIGSGTEVAELREYRPGDSVGRIDWKATARLNDPYVREFEAETTQDIALLVDARESLWVGPRGRSKLAYLREVALGFVTLAESASDPLSLTVLNDQGLHIQHTAAETVSQYHRIRWTLQNLTPEQSSPTPSPRTAPRGPAEASHLAQRLEGRTSSLGRTLRPYFAEPGSYIERLAEDPLFEAVRRSVDTNNRHSWTILFTDDTDPRRTIEAAKMAAKNDGVVTVFVTPSSFFTPQTQQTDQSMYDEYLDFEDFRRELDSIPQVAAYEVTPRERMQAVFAAGRTSSPQPLDGRDA
ncbi:DUF58 domain-containing protein [Halobellus rufus]|uniref:DUF58 domain-containing protein n=1 Tax=Halobellus rufus TaxID=1448860 RepID=UPI0018CDAAFD|nr:DUF58 domain-containing protein [Halobellus rufus]